ncbi:MAG TPA: 3-dehydroquinate synthase [Caulobacteraceae bacterium]
MTSTVTVGLGDRAYDVVIGEGVIAEAGARIAALAPSARLAVVADETVNALHGARLLTSLREAGVYARAVLVPPGEATKSFEALSRLCDDLLELDLDRGDLVVAFGGGVIGDLAGLAAAIYKRGIGYIQIPSTLLAQVDSSVGGKTAIDTARGKNLIGVFHQPRLVLADLDLLATLPPREIACGYAEVLKCALLGDAQFFSWLENDGCKVLALEGPAVAKAVRRAVEMKARIVVADEREAGARALLNLGHTFGHAVEALTGFGGAVKHGEAVGLGCALAFRFSARLGFCGDEDAARASRAVSAAGLPAGLDQIAGHPFAAGALLDQMARDKKSRAGNLRLVLVRGVGEAFVAQDVDGCALREFLLAEGAAP